MKKVLTIILDGLGMREDIYGNAVKNAGMNNFIKLWNKYPHCLLKVNGEHINFPKDQCSSSELGHLILGCGQNVEAHLTRMDEALKKERFKFNPKFTEAVENLKKNNHNLHLIILLSDGGVSSHIRHLVGILKELEKNKVKNNIYIHAISDGKDSDRFSVQKYIKQIEPYLKDNVYLSDICGRYYALDETGDYERTKTYYNMLTEGKGVSAIDYNRVIEKCYNRKLTDEFLPPIITEKFNCLENKDTVLLLNISKFNQMQLLEALYSKNFNKFPTYDLGLNVYSLFEIENSISRNYFFQTTKYTNTLSEYLSRLGLTQARVFERCKLPSMTYYLDGRRNIKLENCDLFCIDSPNIDRYDLKPEMNALTIAKTTIKCMEDDYDFIITNFPNPDMVGHTGNYPKTINSLQAVDVCLGKIIEAAEENFYKVIILSTHAKADTIIDRENNVVTKNTLSPVPFIITDTKIKLVNSDITLASPTILKYLDIAIPKEMKEEDVFIEKLKGK